MIRAIVVSQCTHTPDNESGKIGRVTQMVVAQSYDATTL
jgi:hypothetical protein